MKQGETKESQVKCEIHEWVTNIGKHWSPEFLEIRNVRVLEFSRNGKHRKIWSFWKLNNKWINIPQKLTRVPGCARTVEQILTDVSSSELSESLGADPYLPRGLIESFLRVFKHFSLKIPRGKVRVFLKKAWGAFLWVFFEKTPRFLSQFDQN